MKALKRYGYEGDLVGYMLVARRDHYVRASELVDGYAWYSGDGRVPVGKEAKMRYIREHIRKGNDVRAHGRSLFDQRNQYLGYLPKRMIEHLVKFDGVTKEA